MADDMTGGAVDPNAPGPISNADMQKGIAAMGNAVTKIGGGVVSTITSTLPGIGALAAPVLGPAAVIPAVAAATPQVPQVIDPEGGPTVVPVPPASTTPTPTPSTTTPTGGGTGTGTGSGPTGPTDATVPPYASLSAAVDSVAKPNALNDYYNPTYHFRLFMAQDADILGTANNDISQIANRTVPQVTIAESGVTGWSIKDVRIRTINAQTNQTKNMAMTEIVMTVIDPLGMSFMDGLVDAAEILKIKNLTKAMYYVELTFKAYDEGGFAVRPTQLPNGGLWIWMVYITNIDVKINEGGGVFTLHMLPAADGHPFTPNDNTQRVPNQAMTISGKTVSDMFSDFTTKLNAAWVNHTGGQLVRVGGIVTHPITIGPDDVRGVDPGTFPLKAQTPFQSSQKTWTFDGGADNGTVTCHVPPNSSVSDVITAVIQSTEKGQALMKDQSITSRTDTSASSVNSKGFRESILFSVESDLSHYGFDTTTNQYMKQVVFNVVAHYSQAGILSRDQVDQSRQPSVQNNMILAQIKNGLIAKRYDYIYTGLNTEVLNIDIDFNMAWGVPLPRLAGARGDENASALHALINSGNVRPQGTLYEADQQRMVTPDTFVAPTPTGSAASVTAPSSGSAAVTTPPTTSATVTTPPVAPSMTSTDFDTRGLTTATPTGSAAPAQTFGNIFVEDIEDQLLIPSSLPISFTYGYNDINQESGQRAQPGQFHRDQSLTGALFAQIHGGGPLMINAGSKLMNVELEIRGDPHWLGQTNLNRDSQHRDPEKQAYVAGTSPDWVSAKQGIFVHFAYPLTVGDDFVPVFKTNDMFNGIYEVLEVHSNFAEGSFKQNLKTTRLTLLTNTQSGGATGPNGGPSESGTTTPSTTPTAGTSAPPRLTTPQQQDNASRFRDALKSEASSRGVTLSDAQVDGIVANAYRESSMSPQTSNGAGLLQWTDPSRRSAANAFMQSQYGTTLATSTVEQQAAWTVHEMSTTESSALRKIQATTTAGGAADVMVTAFERSKNQASDQLKNRGFLPNLYGNR